MITTSELNLKIWPDMEQRSEAWYRARAGRPTASQFSRILTPNGKPSSGQAAYAYELIGESLAPYEIEAGFYGNKHTERGNELEPEAVSCFENAMGLQAHPVGFVTREDGIVGCSPDSLITELGRYEWIAGLEIKCPGAKKHAKTFIEGVLPDDHKLQVHGSMAVTGLDYWYFVSYHKRMKPFILRVERDEFTELVSKELDNFVVYYSDIRVNHIPKLRKEVRNE